MSASRWRRVRSPRRDPQHEVADLPHVVVAFPEHEPLLQTGNRIEEGVSISLVEQLVAGHVEHQYLRVLLLRSIGENGGSSIHGPDGMPSKSGLAILSSSE